ncbi:MAG TPA: oligosaccharide flippase family protein [Actinomycetota bacterium]|nr:oligosaccharide flippase family protein [Actinomycetota bacterium]
MSHRAEPTDKETLSLEAAEDVKTVARGGAVQIIGQISQRGLSFLFSAVAARVLGPAGFGLYSQIARILAIGGQLGLAGFNYASMRFIARARVNDDYGGVRGAARVGLWGSSAASAIVVTGLLALAAPIASAFSQGNEASQAGEFASLIRIGVLYIPAFAYMQVLRYCSQAYKTMVPSVIAGNIIQPAARFVLGVALLLAGIEVAGAVATLAASMAVGAAAAFYYWRRIPSDRERSASPHASAAAMVRFALPQAGSSLLGIQSLGLGIIVLGIVSNNRDVGLFAVALALQGPGGVFLSGVVNIWAPVVSDLYEKGEVARLDSLYKTITRWVVTFSFPVYGALIVEPDLFVSIYGGRRLLDAAPLVAIIAVGNLFYSGTGPTGYVLSMTGRPGINFANSVVAVALYALGGALLVPTGGVVAMAWVDAGVTALVNTARVIEAKMLVGVQPFGRSTLKPVGAAAAAVVVLLGWELLNFEPRLLRLVGVALAALVYVLVLWALGLDAEERFVWERIKRRALERVRRP